MIYLPYSDDIRHTEEARDTLGFVLEYFVLKFSDKYRYNLQLHKGSNVAAPHASDDQIRQAANLINRLDLKDFSVFQFANPGIPIFKLWISHHLFILLFK